MGGGAAEAGPPPTHLKAHMLYMLKRVASGVILVFVVTAITFWITHLDTDPIVATVLGVNAKPFQFDAKAAELGFNQPILAQYINWIVPALQGDLGRSYYTDEPVLSALAIRLPVTLSVVTFSIVLTALLSVVLGVAAAIRGGLIDKVLQGVTTVGYILPPILISIVLVVVFAINLHLVPATGYVPFRQSPVGWLSSVILPTLAMTFGGVASVAAQVRGRMIDELSKDYVRTLRSRGISPTAVVLRHALRNAGSPALTTLSLLFIGMFGGVLLIEQIFALPGFGQYAYQASIQSDLPVLLGVVAITVVIVVVMNLLVDILNGLLNPKARTE
jgi:peptide/nickel transport system permease protein